jgi:hypothetical protein
LTELKTYYFKSPENDVYAFQSQSEAPSVFVEITEGEAVNGINKTHDDILTEKLKELAVFTDSMFNQIWNSYSQA